MTSAGRKLIPASAVEMRLLRDVLGLRKRQKTTKRDPEKKDLLLALALALALKKIEKAEAENFLPLGFRKRRVRFPLVRA